MTFGACVPGCVWFKHQFCTVSREYEILKADCMCEHPTADVVLRGETLKPSPESGSKTRRL